MPGYITIANTNFPQADGPINPAQWTTDPTLAVFGVVSHIAETTGAAVCSAHWSADPFALVGNQWAELGIHNLAGNTANFIFLYILVPNVSAASGGFFAQASPDGLGNLILQLFENTGQTEITPTFTIPFVVDAVLRVEFNEGIAVLKYNGITLATIGDLFSHNVDSGPPGMTAGQADVITNATISHFAAGTIVGPPTPGGTFNFRYLTSF